MTRTQCYDDRGIWGIFWCPEVAIKEAFGVYAIKAALWPIELLKWLGVSNTFLTVFFVSIIIIALTAMPILFLYNKLKEPGPLKLPLTILCSAMCAVGTMQVTGGVEYILQLDIHHFIWVFFSYSVIILSLNRVDNSERLNNFFYVLFLHSIVVFLFSAIFYALRSNQYNRVITEFLLLFVSIVIFHRGRKISIFKKGTIEQVTMPNNSIKTDPGKPRF